MQARTSREIAIDRGRYLFFSFSAQRRNHSFRGVLSWDCNLGLVRVATKADDDYIQIDL